MITIAQVAPPAGYAIVIAVGILLGLGLVFCFILLIAKLVDRSAQQWPEHPSRRGAIALFVVDAMALLLPVVVRQPVAVVLAAAPLVVTIGVGAKMTRFAPLLGKLTSALAGTIVLAVLFASIFSAHTGEYISTAWPIGVAVATILGVLWLGVGVIGWTKYLRSGAAAV